MMRERDHLTFRRLGRVLQELRRQGRRGQRKRRSHRVGGDWTDGFYKLIYIGIRERGQTLISSAKTGSKSSSLPSKKGYTPIEH